MMKMSRRGLYAGGSLIAILVLYFYKLRNLDVRLFVKVCGHVFLVIMFQEVNKGMS